LSIFPQLLRKRYPGHWHSWPLLFRAYGRQSAFSVASPKESKEVEMAEKDTGASFAIGFLMGAIVGVAVGFLYAPKPGRETRAILKEKADAAAEKAKETAEKAKEAAVAAEHRVEEKLGRKKPGE
jgi:GGDEF domain-containing protein